MRTDSSTCDMTQLADLRRNYMLSALSETDVAGDPIRQFQNWFDEAMQAKLPEPNAMTLATVGADGQPSARIVPPLRFSPTVAAVSRELR